MKIFPFLITLGAAKKKKAQEKNVCGESFWGVKEARITSPNWPNKAPNGQWCNWVVYNQCAANFTVTPQFFNLMQSSNCEDESVTFFARGPRRQIVYCGAKNDKSDGAYIDDDTHYNLEGLTETITIESSEVLYVSYVSSFDDSLTGGRFSLEITAGYERNSAGVCVDIDECASHQHNCADRIEYCENNVGSYSCLCSQGYERNSQGVCEDIDECARGIDTCVDVIETCANNVGAYNCPCSSGYQRKYPESDCADIDECANGSHTCAATIETCVNNAGAFDCPCSTGYERNSDNVCSDIDECLEGTHTCADTIETCLNNVGSFDCPCSSGYERVDGICVDIDECVREIDDCHVTKDRCDNNSGSYECIRIPMPYETAMSTIREWMDMTAEVLEEAEHDRAGKFDNRMHKLLRNALESYDAFCSSPYNSDKIGKNEFAVWEKHAARSDAVCDQTTTVKAGLTAWVDNYACMDKKNKRQTKRVSKFIERITNPYC